MNASRQGKLVVVSAPSGTGKSSVCARLRSSHPEVGVSISHTTRKPRGGEHDGVEYHFVDDAVFDRMVAEGAFLEWARVFDRRYGSSHAEVNRLLQSGKDVLFDIDVQGGFQIRRARPEALLVFLLPPSVQELMRRLRGRATDSESEIHKRLHTAAWELEQGRDYDFHVVNDALDRAVAAVDAIRCGRASEPHRREDLLEQLILLARSPGREAL